MNTPSVILTSQFTTPTAKSFTDYLKYMTRDEALQEQEKKLTSEELREQEIIKQTISKYEMKFGNAALESNSAFKDQKEEEALSLLKGPGYFGDLKTDYTQYIGYMGRHYALQTKETRSELEEKELSVVRKKFPKWWKRKKKKKA